MQRKNKIANTPANNDRRRFILTEETPFRAKEAYKTLRTNVMFSLPGVACKCIGVTSSSASEGKSTTAINLAISLAQIDKRVLLIDADMRLPSVASRLGIKSEPGFSDFLVGEAKIDDAVRSVEKYGIQVLPAGSVPPDPTGLLEAKQLEHLLSAVRKIYDYVIVDLPPVNSVPDAIILTKHIDGYLMMAQEKATRHKDINEALKQMKLAGANIIGFVVNSSTLAKRRYYY